VLFEYLGNKKKLANKKKQIIYNMKAFLMLIT